MIFKVEYSKILFISLVSLLIFFTFNYVEAVSVRYDVNQDGYINTVDSMLVLKKSLNMDVSNTTWKEDINTGDVNCDNTINSIDAQLLFRKSLGFEINEADLCSSNETPKAIAGSNRNAKVNQIITLSGKANDIDGNIVSYEWKDGNNIISNSVSFPYKPIEIGEHTLTFTITDNDGLTDSDSLTVLVTEAEGGLNKVPVADAGLVKYAKINQVISIKGNGSDVDGHIVSYQWKEGSTVLSNTDLLSYTPTTLGKKILTFIVTDDKGLTNSDDLVVFTIGGNVSSNTINITVTGGGGNYECDGIDDEVQINQAIADVASSGNGGIVHIGDGIFTISNPIEIVSENIILEGNGMNNTTIKLVDEADWGEIQGQGDSAKYIDADPIIRNSNAFHNISVRNLKIDGNKYNQHYTHPTRGWILVPDGTANYPGIEVTSQNERASNILISNVYVYENNVDAFIINNADNIIIENNKTLRIGHSATYFLDPVNLLVENNNITISANSGIRWYDGNHIIVRNNFIQGDPGKDGNSNFAIEVTSGQTSRILDDLLIENNLMRFTASAAIALDAKKPSQATDTVIRNNIIYQCGNVGTWVSRRETGAINLKNFTNTLIENNTIVNTIGSAIRLGGNVGFNDEWDEVLGTTAIIHNNIITNSIDDDSMSQETSAYGIEIADGHSAICTYNNVWNNHSGNYKGCNPGTGSVSENPKFKNIVLGTNFNNTNDENADFHLKSTIGRWNEATSNWEVDIELSGSINAGDLSSTYSNEVNPNGNRINLGAYGNTEYASKGNSAPPITIAGNNQYLRADSKGYVRVNLDGSNSSDEGSIVSYKWKKDGILFGEGEMLSSVAIGVGIHTIMLEVTDNDGNLTSDTIIVRINPNFENISPHADSGDDIIVTDVDDSGAERVKLTSKNSYDEDGIIVDYIWSENGVEISNIDTPVLDFSVGLHTVSLKVVDIEGKTDTDIVMVEVKEKNDYALNFNGDGSIGEFVAIDDVPTSFSDLTIEMWIKQTGTNGDTDALINFGASDGQRLLLNTGLGGLPSWGLDDYSDTGITMNEWHHLAFVVSGNILTNIYIDGVSQSITGDGNIIMPSSDFSIGSFYQRVESNLDFHGVIDELRIWSEVRSSADIVNNKDIELVGNENNLVSYWDFNEGSGTKLIDKTDNKKDGNLHEMEQSDWVLGAINPH